MKTGAIPIFSAESANAKIDIERIFSRVIKSHRYILSNEVSSFEDEFSSYIGTRDCISVANGSDALEIALRALGVGAGKLVATVANAGFYSSTAIHSLGATPLYVDIEPTTMLMSPEALQIALKRKPAAVIVTHLYGKMANMDAILSVTRKHNVPVIEDCAQAHGARRDGLMAGSRGDLSCFSFYPTKNLGALGDGGAILTNNLEHADHIRRLRQYGWSKKYHVSTPGGRNSRMDEIQAAILREKLPHLDDWNAERRKTANMYNAALRSTGAKVPDIGEDHVAHLYIIETSAREKLADEMLALGITTDIHYPIPDHLQEAYLKCDSEALPETERICERILTLPCFPGMLQEEKTRVVNAILRFREKNANA